MNTISFRYIEVLLSDLKKTNIEYFDEPPVLELMIVLFLALLITGRYKTPNITDLSQVFKAMSILFKALRNCQPYKLFQVVNSVSIAALNSLILCYKVKWLN